MAAAVCCAVRILCADIDSMQMETALNHVHASRKFLGLESTRESMKLFADMIHEDKGYDKDELDELYHWVTEVQWKGKIYPNVEGVAKPNKTSLLILKATRTSTQRRAPSQAARRMQIIFVAA